jgi:hypothetical protein
MNELIEQLKSRVGLDDNKAHSAAQTVLDFLKQRLPAPVASQLDSALSGGVEGIKDQIGGVLGKKTAGSWPLSSIETRDQVANIFISFIAGCG